MENPVEGPEPSQVANRTAPNKGCIEDSREHSSADQSTNNGRVEAPKRADSTMNDAQPGKALLSNHRDMPSTSELGAEMFHPPKMPQRQRNGNGTGFQRVPVENPLNADVAPVADPFFQPLLAVVYRCWFNGRCCECNGCLI